MKSLSKKMLLVAALAFSGASVKADFADFLTPKNGLYTLCGAALVSNGLALTDDFNLTKTEGKALGYVTAYNVYISLAAVLGTVGYLYSNSK